MKATYDLFVYGDATSGGWSIQVEVQGARLYRRREFQATESGESVQTRAAQHTSVNRKRTPHELMEGFAVIEREFAKANTILEQVNQMWATFFGPMGEDQTRYRNLGLRVIKHDDRVHYAGLHTFTGFSRGHKAFGEVKPKSWGERNPDLFQEDAYLLEYARQDLASLFK